MIAETTTLHARVVVIGDAQVGKTSILNQLVEHTFNPYEQTTVGTNYQLYVADVDGVKIEIQIWDTAGQEKFRSLSPIYYRNAVAAVAVYDQTDRSSFEHLDKWIHSFTEVAGMNTIIAIAGNKCDLADLLQVSYTEAEGWAKSHNYLIEQTSAMTGLGIRNLFQRLAEEILKNESAVPQKRDSPQRKEEKPGCAC